MSADVFSVRVRAVNGATLRVAVVAAGVLILLQPSPCLAEAAYAFGQGEFGAWVSGYGNNYTTQNEAQAVALQKCAGRGIACSIIANFHKTCFAIAVQDLGNGWAVRYAPDLPSASRNALQGCNSMGLSCSVKDSFCDTISEQELQQAAADQANREFQDYQREWRECFFGPVQTELDIAAAIASCNQALAFPRGVAADRDQLVRQRAGLQVMMQQIHDQNRRAEQQRRQDEADRQQYFSQQGACASWDEIACIAALRSPLADDDDREHMRGRLAVIQRFKDDLVACRDGSVAACDIALASPAAHDDDRRYVQQWRQAASPFNKAIAVVLPYWDAARFGVESIPPSTMIAVAVAVVLALVLVGIMLRQRRVKPQAIVTAVAEPLSRDPMPHRGPRDHASHTDDIATPETVAAEPAAAEIAGDKPTAAPKLDRAAIKQSLITRRQEFEL